ncbi:MAG: hypothetical protein EB127_13810 [Alphaproteobacteria bacterium]|nr:hypothetical protein [Alphaproteobacteria bacterium]
MSRCIKPGCTSFANPATGSGLCNKHYAEEHGISMSQAAAIRPSAHAAAARAADAEREALLREAGGWWEEMRPPSSRGAVEAQTFLALGVHPAEPRETKVRGFFEMPNVFLLDRENQHPGFDYSRYVQLDWDKEGSLERLATKVGGRFDQVAFDHSTMCSFRYGETTSRFNALYKMLKPNGVLFLSEIDHTHVRSLRNAGFQEVREVPLDALGGTLVDLLRIRERTPTGTVIVGIKREGADGGGGGAGAEAQALGADAEINEQLRILLEIIKKGRHNIGGKRSRRKTRRRKHRK